MDLSGAQVGLTRKADAFLQQTLVRLRVAVEAHGPIQVRRMLFAHQVVPHKNAPTYMPSEPLRAFANERHRIPIFAKDTGVLWTIAPPDAANVRADGFAVHLSCQSARPVDMLEGDLVRLVQFPD